jgi:anti-sigma regulatory factor (Ser/Thr protein kinase)
VCAPDRDPLPRARLQVLPRVEQASGFDHEALFYSSDEGFLAGTVPAIAAAIERGEPVLVAVAPAKTSLLRDALGSAAGEVRFADMHVLGRNPGRIISAWQDFLERDAPAGGQALGIGEPVWPGRSREQIDECERHEWLVNLAFCGGRPWRLVCPYDVDGLDDAVLEVAMHNHPAGIGHVAHGAAAAHDPGDWLARAFAGELDQPGVAVLELEFDLARIRAARLLVRARAESSQLGAERTRQLVLAVSELASNSVLYGGGSGIVRVWESEDAVVCEVWDRGRLDAPLAGRLSPAPNQLTGRGLWLVHQLCDLVQVRSNDARTVVRVQVNL